MEFHPIDIESSQQVCKRKLQGESCLERIVDVLDSCYSCFGILKCRPGTYDYDEHPHYSPALRYDD